MAYSGNSPVHMQKLMAQGHKVDTGADDVAPLSTLMRGLGYSGASKVHGDYLPDHKRGAGRPVKHTRGKHPAQANADHGPHGCGPI